ncbi:MAG: serine protease [Sulfuricellaceae bacterium]|nr:serine protease [Sulfuricellaceae bacterium]
MKKVADVTKPPFNSVGKLSFKQGEEFFTGTAFVVSQKGLFTAAHNFYSDDQATTEAYFSLWTSGSDKEPSVWQLDLEQVKYPDGWTEDEELKDDMAVCKIADESFASAAIPLAVSEKDFKKPETIPSTAIGFPTDTDDMYETSAEAIATSEGHVMKGGFDIGASGGPWIDEDGVVFGITAEAEKGDMSSPLLGQQAAALIEWLG